MYQEEYLGFERFNFTNNAYVYYILKQRYKRKGNKRAAHKTVKNI